MNDKTKLLPCPFCGGQAEIDTLQGYRNIVTGALETAVSVYCESCDANCTSCRGDHPDLDPQIVIDRWNTRAAPAEDVRAGGGEPVACYVATDDLEAIQSGSKMWATAWATDSAMNPSRSFSRALYSHPQSPVAPQCSEVTSQCSEHLRTQGRPLVLPERYDETHYRGGSLLAVRRWNACIDEFERLNK